MTQVNRKYVLEDYMRPIWEGDTVAHESVMFREDEHAVRLTYPITEVYAVSVAEKNAEQISNTMIATVNPVILPDQAVDITDNSCPG